MKPFFETRTYNSEHPIHAAIGKDFSFLAHWHIDIEIVYVLNGNIRIGINKECKTLSKGEVAICNSNDIHYYDSTDMHSDIIVVIFQPEYINNMGGWPQNLRFPTPFIDNKYLSQLGDNIVTHLRDIFLCLVNECNMKEKHYNLFIKSKVLELCAMAFRYFPTHSVETAKENSTIPYMRPMQEALQYLEENYMKDISLDELAHRVNFSPFYLSRLFKQVTGINFKAFLNSIRVDKAKGLISSSSKSMAEISYECGFNSIRAFNRAFKSVLGCTPSDTRRLQS